MLIGSFLGGRFGSIPGSVIGAIAGHFAEEKLFGKSRRQKHRHHRQQRPDLRFGENPSMVFCASAAAMLAKMAKADGVVTKYEIACVEQAFRRLGFTPAARRYAIDVFRQAKNDDRSIYDYAADFAETVDSPEVRELLYEILWDVAGADGSFGQNELLILQRMPRALGIPVEWYGYFASQRLRGGGCGSAARDPLAEAYSLLGASAADSADELRRKYRELAKRNHPDVLRAQGLPEEMVGRATERMSRINEAWSVIREARGL